jgi:RNA polymerase sigma-54 factor
LEYAVSLETKLRLTQSTSLVLNAALLQAIKLLPMARLELVQAIQQELMDNPLLEEVALAEDGFTPADAEEAASPAAEADHVADGQELYEVNWAEYFPDAGDWPGLPSDAGADALGYEPTVRTPTTLSEHLLSQLLLTPASAEERRVGAWIIGNLDDDGYWRGTLPEAAAATATELATVTRALTLVQSLEPTGVGARDLAECLGLQIRALGLEGSVLETVVATALPLLEGRGAAAWQELAQVLRKRLQLSSAEVSLALRLFKQLDPAPGERYTSTPAEAIVPDILVLKVGQDYQVVLNDEGIPRLRISAPYRQLLREGALGQPDTKQYLEERLRSAVWLIRSIEQRRQTLAKVATSLVKFQREFLDHGLASLKPLVLKDVAEDIGMHESTVSRVTTAKYMYTPQGLFELKYFFHSGLASYGGEAHSSLTVKARLQQLVAAEDPAHPLTDQQLVERLAAARVKIARRTVTKYRRELRLPPANRRKQIPEG